MKSSENMLLHNVEPFHGFLMRLKVSVRGFQSPTGVTLVPTIIFVAPNKGTSCEIMVFTSCGDPHLWRGALKLSQHRPLYVGFIFMCHHFVELVSNSLWSEVVRRKVLDTWTTRDTWSGVVDKSHSQQLCEAFTGAFFKTWAWVCLTFMSSLRSEVDSGAALRAGLKNIHVSLRLMS